MLSKVLTSATYGIDAFLVDVETNIESGMPMFIMVGLPDNAVKESRERVASALKNSGFSFPVRKITLNLAPADLKKEGTSFDLPIAVGILSASGQLGDADLSDSVFLGELSLDGSVRQIHGALSVAIEMEKRGLRRLYVPMESAAEASIVSGIEVYPVRTLRELVESIIGVSPLAPFSVDRDALFSYINKYHFDFADVKGQQDVKYAIEVAAAGGHNILLIGPPGSGKTMLAQRLPSILPPLTFEEALETTKIHSIAGILPAGQALVTERPFRSPHHTVSDAALVGGGSFPRPGEVSYAHHGVLFLDELPEFKKHVLEVLRQPLEEGKITVSRSKMSLVFPANTMLAAAMNPCPCGYFGFTADMSHRCTCSPVLIQKYIGKISGPLLDRIDIHIDVPKVQYKELASEERAEPSERIRERVLYAREIQRKRFAAYDHIFTNADMTSREVRQYCKLDAQSSEVLKMAITNLGLSARAYDRILKVSRTIADLEGEERITTRHVSQAVQYRSLDREFWNRM